MGAITHQLPVSHLNNKTKISMKVRLMPYPACFVFFFSQALASQKSACKKILNGFNH